MKETLLNTAQFKRATFIKEFRTPRLCYGPRGEHIFKKKLKTSAVWKPRYVFVAIAAELDAWRTGGGYLEDLKG
jgi:hypothetical protein